MENKIISINITPENNDELTENAGVMWEHNATTLKFNIDSVYIGNYRYYIEYRSLLGTKVRTDYLELDASNNTVLYTIPASMSSLKGAECYFNIVGIDEDGNTVQVIKPKKFCLTFDYSPDTDNSLAKVNDFSINALLEAIRLGTFKGDKGDKGEKGDKGDKGDKGEKGQDGEVTSEYANSHFSNAVKCEKCAGAIYVDDVSPKEHVADIQVKSKNIWQGTPMLNVETVSFQQEVNIVSPVTVSLKRTDDFAYSNNGWVISITFADGTSKYILSGEIKETSFSKVFTATEENPITKIGVRKGFISAGELYDIQVEYGETATVYTANVPDLSQIVLMKCGKNLWKKSDVTVNGAYSTVVLNRILLPGVTYTLSADVESTDTDHTTCYVYAPTNSEALGQLGRGLRQSITFTPKKPVDKITFYSSNYSINGQGDLATFKNIQIEVGQEVTEYELYNEYEQYGVTSDGKVDGVKTVYPRFTLCPLTPGVMIECKYNRDINKVIEKLCNAIVSLGGTV